MRHDIFTHTPNRQQRDREIRMMPIQAPTFWGVVLASPRATIGGLMLGAVFVLLALTAMVML